MQGALDAELGDVARASVGASNAKLNRTAFRLGQFASAGVGASEPIAAALLDAAQRAGIEEAPERSSIASGLRAGLASLRPLPPANG